MDIHNIHLIYPKGPLKSVTLLLKKELYIHNLMYEIWLLIKGRKAGQTLYLSSRTLASVMRERD